MTERSWSVGAMYRDKGKLVWLTPNRRPPSAPASLRAEEKIAVPIGDLAYYAGILGLVIYGCFLVIRQAVRHHPSVR